jgi:hypothetical protein
MSESTVTQQKATHTTGPWHDVPPMNQPNEFTHRVITGGPHGLPHIAYVPKNSYAAVEALANAQLIAAAPELLAALKRIEACDEHDPDGLRDTWKDLCYRCMAIAREAIAKAEATS